MCHRIWCTLHAPFLMPTCICEHKWGVFQNQVDSGQAIMLAQSRSRRKGAGVAPSDSDSAWEVYEFNQAGCVLCGIMHICFDGVCPVEQNDEGYNICTITGMCVKELNFSNEEYVDTACIYSSSAATTKHPILLEGDAADPRADCSPVSKQNKCCPVGLACTESGSNGGNPLEPGRLYSILHRSSLSSDGADRLSNRCSVNKKNRYRYVKMCDAFHDLIGSIKTDPSRRSWVYHKVMHHHNHPSISKGKNVGLVTLQRHRSMTTTAVTKLPGQSKIQKTPPDETHVDSTRNHIHSFVSDVLCSSKWKRSMEMEVCHGIIGLSTMARTRTHTHRDWIEQLTLTH